MEYELIENFTDNAHNTVFQTQVLLNGLLAGIGTGYSKKESQQQASQMALVKIRKERDFKQDVLKLSKKEVVVEDDSCEVSED